jgi:UDP-N-acetylglucosamine acyltransferase
MINQPLASIHPDAVIGPGVEIGPFVFIDKNVEIGEGTRIAANATILEGSRIGKFCNIFPGAVIGAIPQDLKFKGEQTLAIIGDHTTIRECVTVNRGTVAKGKTIVGSHCLLMAYSHVAHDCMIGDYVIIANASQLAGEVEIDNYAILGGGTLIHQFTKVGKHVMIQGGCKVTKDVPPFVTAGRDPLTYAGINSIGLRRRGYSNEQISEIHDAYRIIYQDKLNTSNALSRITETIPASAEREEIVQFIKGSSRGIIKGYFEE